MTTQSAPIPTTGDSFSFRRVWTIMKLMFPRLRGVMLTYLAVGVIATALTILASRWTSMFFPLLPFIVFFPALLFYIAPIFTTNTMTASSLTALPATAGEKLTALSLCGLIILPCLCYFFCQLTVTLISTSIEYGGNPGVMDYVSRMSPILMVLNALSSLLAPIVCQYAALCRPGKRLFAAMMCLLVPVSLGIVGGVLGVTISLRRAISEGSPSSIDVDQYSLAILHDLTPWVWAINIISVALCGLFLWLSYRKLLTRQV